MSLFKKIPCFVGFLLSIENGHNFFYCDSVYSFINNKKLTYNCSFLPSSGLYHKVMNTTPAYQICTFVDEAKETAKLVGVLINYYNEGNIREFIQRF